MLRPYEKKGLVAIAVAAAPVFILYCIWKYSSPVPFWDQWELVPLLEKMHNGTLSIRDLWAQHNEHRILFPHSVMLALAAVSGWSIYCELLTSFALVVGTMLFLRSLLKRTFGGSVPIWVGILFSVVVFSPVQWENWTWGWQIQIFMNALAVVVAVWAMDRWPGQLKGVLAAIAATVVASYSFSNGLFAWVAVGLFLLLRKPRKWGHVGLWALAAAVTIGLFLWGYVKPAHHPALSIFLHHPWLFTQYILLYVGAPIWSATPFMDVVGALLVIVLVTTATMAVRSRGIKLQELLPWLTLAAYVLISAAVTGIGRLGFGAGQATSSRYTTFAMLLVLAVIVCWSKWLDASRNKNGRLAPGYIMATIAALAIFAFGTYRSYDYGIQGMAGRKKLYDACYGALKEFPNTPEPYLLGLYPDANIIRQRAQTLQNLGIILHKQPQQQSAGGR
jgi:hypothetical protein